MIAMPIAAVNGLELFYDVSGPDDGVPLLLVMGLGAQYHDWDDDFVAGLTDRGFRVVRYDNRDVGETTHVDSDGFSFQEQFTAVLGGAEPTSLYLVSDMAADASGLLDHLGISAAHVVGASMGGMIAQQLAIDHPEQVLTLTSIMSTTGDPDVGQPSAEAMAVLIAPQAEGREALLDQRVASGRVICSPDHYDEARARARVARSYDRDFYPAGVGHQLLAILASGSRTEQLRTLRVPTLVIHGEIDPLVGVSGGQRTAEVVPGAELLLIPDMAHDLPQVHWPQIIEAITTLASRVAA
jgi:pimeloyl-ACP methyl ester carboxylesterase